MRCTSCHRPAVPQAVGVTPAGVLVFGWCVACLESNGCDQIVVAPRVRRPTTRLALETSFPRASTLVRRRGPLEARRRLAAGVCLLLAFWGVVLFAVGLILWWRGPRHQAVGAPVAGMGVGGPALLIGGGGATAAVGFLLWSLNSGLLTPRPVRALRVVQGLAFVAATGTLLAGIVFRSPRRDPMVVGVASAALVVSAVARWIEVRRGLGIGWSRPELP